MSAVDELEQVAPPGAGESDDGWRTDKHGKAYVPRVEGRGVIYRQGQETVAQALERDAKPKPERPKRRVKKPKLQEAPRRIELKLLEEEIRGALKAPAALCTVLGENGEWPAEHFLAHAPNLARNLVLASEHNPWLRRQLEEVATGEQALGKIISLFAVGGALFMYTVPPAIYFLNLPVSPKTRAMLGDIPDRRMHPPVDAFPAASPPAAAAA